MIELSDDLNLIPRAPDAKLQLIWRRATGRTARRSLLNIPTDLESPAVIDGDRRSLGSHGKDGFVYSALSSGSAWQLDLYCGGPHRRLAVWGAWLSGQVRCAPLLSSQCILMQRGSGGGKKIGSASDRRSDPETRAKGKKGRSQRRNWTFCLESQM